MTEALGAQVDRAPDRFWPSGLTGMTGQAKSFGLRSQKRRAEYLRRTAAFVAADSEADHLAVAVFEGEINNGLGLFHAKLAHRIKQPQHGNTKIALPALASAFHTGKERIEIELAHQAHPHGAIDFGVQNVLCSQALHHAVGDQLVVFRRAQSLSDCLEGHQETLKIGVAVELSDGFRRERLRIVLAAKLD